MLESIWLTPPIAVARLGSSDTPCGNFCWGPTDNSPGGTGKTTLQPLESVELGEDGSPRLVPATDALVFKDRDADGTWRYRPVCPYFELNGQWSVNGVTETGPVTKNVLDVDAIVSVMGNWTTESLLNHWHRHHGRPLPIIYGWTEDHALAGSAVVITRTGGCLACGLNRIGAPIEPVTLWPEEQSLSTEPSCADHFRPYGAVELAGTTSMISETVIDELLEPHAASYRKLWIGRIDSITELGGTLNPKLQDQFEVQTRAHKYSGQIGQRCVSTVHVQKKNRTSP